MYFVGFVGSLKSVENETEMRKLLSSANSTHPSRYKSLGVAFLNLPHDKTIPDKLNYKILVVNWKAKTNELYAKISPDPSTGNFQNLLIENNVERCIPTIARKMGSNVI